MEMNKKLLTVAVSSALLAACGGSSSSGDRAPYTLGADDAIPAGKAFVAKLDTTVMAAAEEAGKFAGSIEAGLYDVDVANDGSVETQLKDSIAHFVDAVISVAFISDLLRSEAEHYELWEEYQNIVLGKVYDTNDDMYRDLRVPAMGPGPMPLGPDTRYQFMEDDDGNLLVNVLMTPNGSDVDSQTTITFNMVYNKVSAVESDITISGSLVNEFDAVSVEISDLLFKTNTLLTGTTMDVTMGDINGTFGSVTATASASMSLVAGKPSAENGTAAIIIDELTDGNSDAKSIFGYGVSLFSGLSPAAAGKLNLASLELSDVRIENDLGQYLAMNAIYEDADAADFEGAYGGNAGVVDYAFSEDLNTLVLSDAYGKTTYSYVEKAAPAPESIEFAAVSEEPSLPGYILCEVEDKSSEQAAPELRNIYCNDDGEVYLGGSSYDNLQDAIVSRRYDERLRYQGHDSQYVTYESQIEQNLNELEGQFEIQLYQHKGIDDIAEPVTFSVSINGEFGQVDGNVIPFTASLNHPYADMYDYDATIGTEGNTVTYDESSDKSVIVISSSVAYTGDANVPTADVAVTFEIDRSETEEPEEGDRVIGVLKVEGTEVAELKAIESNVNGNVMDDFYPDFPIDVDYGDLEDYFVNYPAYLQFTDGSYPVDGKLISTVEDLRTTTCPEQEGVQEAAIEVCYADQQGVVNVKALLEVFYQGMPTNSPFWEPTPEEGEEGPK